jgi:hypothetical protein
MVFPFVNAQGNALGEGEELTLPCDETTDMRDVTLLQVRVMFERLREMQLWRKWPISGVSGA